MPRPAVRKQALAPPTAGPDGVATGATIAGPFEHAALVKDDKSIIQDILDKKAAIDKALDKDLADEKVKELLTKKSKKEKKEKKAKKEKKPKKEKKESHVVDTTKHKKMSAPQPLPGEDAPETPS